VTVCLCGTLTPGIDSLWKAVHSLPQLCCVPLAPSLLEPLCQVPSFGPPNSSVDAQPVSESGCGVFGSEYLRIQIAPIAVSPWAGSWACLWFSTRLIAYSVPGGSHLIVSRSFMTSA
jgi:hypothetical protein